MRSIAATFLAALLLILSQGAAAAQTVVIDTVIGATDGTRLELHTQNGSVQVGSWDRAAIRVVARAKTAAPIRIESRGSHLMVHAPGPRRGNDPVAFDLTVPRSADVSIHGQNAPVTLRDAGGRVEVHTINGAITVNGGRGRVELHSVNGRVEVNGSRGDVSISTVNHGATLRNVSGTISVSAVNGTVRLDGIDSRSVEATTVQGEIHFAGALRSDGVYRLNSHNGLILMRIACDASAHVTVVTYNGSLRSECPVTLTEGPNARRFDITLGAGQAQVELTSFNGKIELRP